MGRMPVDLGELVEHWTLLDDEQELVISKRGATKLGFALLLKFCTLQSLSHYRGGSASRNG
jgi:hypothetical protein